MTLLWTERAEEVHEQYQPPDGPEKLAEYLRSQCMQHADGYQSECKYLIEWRDENGEALGSFRLRVVPREANTQRFTGSMDNVIVQMQRHNEALVKQLVESTGAQVKAMTQLIDLQSRALATATQQAEEAKGGDKAIAELETLLQEAQQDNARHDQLMEVLQQIALPLMSKIGGNPA